MSGAPTGLEDFGLDPFSVVADVHAELAALVPDLHLDPAGLGVPDRVPQQFPGDPVDLVLEQRLQIPPLPSTSRLIPPRMAIRSAPLPGGRR